MFIHVLEIFGNPFGFFANQKEIVNPSLETAVLNNFLLNKNLCHTVKRQLTTNNAN